METHPGPGLILADTETKVKKYDALVQTRENQVQYMTLMYGHDARFQVAVQGVTSLDEKSLATWMEDGKDYEVPTFPLDIVKSELLPEIPETMRNLVENLSPSLVMEIIAQPVSGLKPTYRILESLAKHCKYGIVKKALDCLIAYRLATSPVVSDGTSSLFDSGQGRVDSETSRLHGKTAVSPLISTKLRLVLLRVWQQKRTELLDELSQYKMIQKWLVMLILLLNLEDVEFDCKYRDLKVVEVEEASARVKKHIQTFLIEIGFNSKSLDIGMNDVDGKVVGNILNYNSMCHFSSISSETNCDDRRNDTCNKDERSRICL